MPKTFSLADLLWLLLFFALVAGVAALMFYVRDVTLASSPDQSQQQWDEWRAAVQKGEENRGPVQRRVPESPEPPALRLMRDHFAVCLVGALVISSLVFGTFVLLMRGALQSPSPVAGKISSPSPPRESPGDA